MKKHKSKPSKFRSVTVPKATAVKLVRALNGLQPIRLFTLAAQERSGVLEALRLWGDFPDHTEANATHEDWIHVLLTSVTDLAEKTRFDVNDPQVQHDIRRHLAQLIATCKAWDEQILSED